MSGETKPFRERLKDGLEFEDFCVDVLWDHGIPLLLYRSKDRQWKSGESRLGAEIKLDRKWHATNNLFIECEERRNDDGSSGWRAAGIYDETKPWLYVIGNEDLLWIHGVRILQLLHTTGRYEWKETATAKGFVLPVPESDRYALKIIDPTTRHEQISAEPFNGKPSSATREELRDPEYTAGYNRPFEPWPDAANRTNPRHLF